MFRARPQPKSAGWHVSWSWGAIWSAALRSYVILPWTKIVALRRYVILPAVNGVIVVLTACHAVSLFAGSLAWRDKGRVPIRNVRRRRYTCLFACLTYWGSTYQFDPFRTVIPAFILREAWLWKVFCVLLLLLLAAKRILYYKNHFLQKPSGKK